MTPAENQARENNQVQIGGPVYNPSTLAQSPITIYRGTRQPPVNTRLQQAFNFLADEDFHRHLRFPEKVDEIDVYVEYLESEEFKKHQATWGTEEPIVSLLNDVKHMVEVQQARISRATERSSITFDFPRVKVPGNRLLSDSGLNNLSGLRGRIAYELSGLEDLPRPGWSSPARLHQGLDLMDLCQLRVKELDPMFYTKKLANYRQHQKSLADFARSLELTKRLHDTSYVPAPINWNGPYIRVSKEDAKDGIWKRLGYLANVVERLIEASTAAPRPLIETVIENIGHGECGAQKPVLSDGSRFPGTVQDLDEPINSAEIEALLMLAGRSSVVKRSLPKQPSTTKIVQDNMTSFIIAVEATFPAEGGVNKMWPSANHIVFRNDLLFHINTNRREMFSKTEADGWLKYMRDTMRIRLPSSDGVQRPLPDVHPEDGPTNFHHSVRQHTLIETRKDVISTVTPDLIRSSPSKWKDYTYQILALRLGREITRMQLERETSGVPEGEQEPAALEVRNFMSLPTLPQHESLMEIAIHLAEHHEIAPPANEEEAVQNLQWYVVLESNRNWEKRLITTPFEKLWGWAHDVTGPEEPYFSLKRYPLRLQTPERQAEIRASGLGRYGDVELPDPEGLEEDEHDGSWAKRGVSVQDSKMRYIKGDCYFPFGETPFQAAVMSQLIDDQLRDVPEFAYIYKIKPDKHASQTDPCALPDLPAGWTMQKPHGRGSLNRSSALIATETYPETIQDDSQPAYPESPQRKHLSSSSADTNLNGKRVRQETSDPPRVPQTDSVVEDGAAKEELSNPIAPMPSLPVSKPSAQRTPGRSSWLQALNLFGRTPPNAEHTTPAVLRIEPPRMTPRRRNADEPELLQAPPRSVPLVVRVANEPIMQPNSVRRTVRRPVNLSERDDWLPLSPSGSSSDSDKRGSSGSDDNQTSTDSTSSVAGKAVKRRRGGDGKD